MRRLPAAHMRVERDLLVAFLDLEALALLVFEEAEGRYEAYEGWLRRRVRRPIGSAREGAAAWRPPPLLGVVSGPGDAVVADILRAGHPVARARQPREPVLDVTQSRYPFETPHSIQRCVAPSTVSSPAAASSSVNAMSAKNQRSGSRRRWGRMSGMATGPRPITRR